MARDDGVVFAHLREPLAGASVVFAELLFPERRVRDLAHQGVLEPELPRPPRNAHARARRGSRRLQARAGPRARAARQSTRGRRPTPSVRRQLSFHAASRPVSSSASRCTCMAASIVGASAAFRPAAASRPSSSAKSGSPADCWAIESTSASPRSPIARSPKIVAAIDLACATRVSSSSRSVVAALEPGAGSSRRNEGLAAASTHTGQPAARARRWSTHERLSASAHWTSSRTMTSGLCFVTPTIISVSTSQSASRAPRVSSSSGSSSFATRRAMSSRDALRARDLAQRQ